MAARIFFSAKSTANHLRQQGCRENDRAIPQFKRWPTSAGSLVFVFMAWAISGSVHAQNIDVSTPFHSYNDSFFESFGVNFQFGIPGGTGSGSRVVGLSPFGQLTPNLIFAQQGAGVIPQFGGYNPNAGGQLNFSGNGFSLGLNFAQGNTRSSVSNVPSMTVQNGFGGDMFSGQVRPFVTGVIPIIGANANLLPPPIDNAVTRAINSGQLDLSSRSASPDVELPQSSDVLYSDATSSATHGDSSVAAIKAARKNRLAARQRELAELLAAADRLVAEQEYVLARAKFRAALRIADEASTKKVINAKIAATREK